MFKICFIHPRREIKFHKVRINVLSVCLFARANVPGDQRIDRRKC